jgi:hypothetical protein
MTELLQLAIEHYQSDTLLFENVEGPFAFACPPKLLSVFPHAYVLPFGGKAVVKETYPGMRVERTVLRFVTEHTDLETLCAYHDRVEELFARRALGGGTKGAMRVHSNIDLIRGRNGEPSLSPQGDPVYYSVVDWLFYLQSLQVNSAG